MQLDDLSLFDRITERRATGSLKWARYENRDILPMWVADMDFPSPAPILDAIRQRLDHGILGYSVATPDVADAVLNYLLEKHSVRADASWLTWLPGMVPALALCAAISGDSGDAVMTCTPVYPPFLKAHRDAGRELITVPLAIDDAGRHTFDFDAMERAVTPRTRLLILCSPHNPVGRVWSRSELEGIAAFCERHDLLLCSDEIHCDLLLEPDAAPHTTALRLPDALHRRLIVLMAASKTYNVAGLGLAFAIIPDASLRRRFQAAKNTFVAETNPLSFAATAAAYNHCEPWRLALTRYLRGNRDRLAAFLAERCPSVTMPHIEATYLAWLDVRSLGLEHPAAHFEAHGLALNNGADFGAPGFVRLNFGCPRLTLEEGLSRFAAALP
jgi:cystathionine beta-lyase